MGAISNGVLNNMKHVQQNGHVYQNGMVNGAVHMLQNGAAHLANGTIPDGNIGRQKPAVPTMNNYLPKDPIRKMYNEVESYQHNLHM